MIFIYYRNYLKKKDINMTSISISPSRFFIECNCGSIEHLLVFDLFQLDDDEEFIKEHPEMIEVSVKFTSNYHLPFFRRIWAAIKFIFEREPFTSDDILVNEENLHQLRNLVDNLTFVYDKAKIKEKSKEIETKSSKEENDIVMKDMRKWII